MSDVQRAPLDHQYLDALMEGIRTDHVAQDCCSEGKYCGGCDPTADSEGCAESPWPCEMLDIANALDTLRADLQAAHNLVERYASKMLRIGGLARTIMAEDNDADDTVIRIAETIETVATGNLTPEQERTAAVLWGVFDG